jgi:hypothetical protein
MLLIPVALLTVLTRVLILTPGAVFDPGAIFDPVCESWLPDANILDCTHCTDCPPSLHLFIFETTQLTLTPDPNSDPCYYFYTSSDPCVLTSYIHLTHDLLL